MRVDFLDVGHGSCVVVRSGAHVAIIDVGGAPRQVHEFLTTELPADSDGRIKIEALVITHMHEDHYRGLPAILYDGCFEIGALYANRDLLPEGLVDDSLLGRMEMRLHEAIVCWQRRTGKQVCSLLDGEGFSLGTSARFTAVWPAAIPTWPGGVRNTDSIVGRVEDDEDPGMRVLVTGDADARSFAGITARSALAILSDVLLFPHHGGLPGGADPTRFASALCRTVKADRVVIQNGTRWVNHPHKKILAGIRQAGSVHEIACTELSGSCGRPHPSDVYAPRCAGTVTVDGGPSLQTERPHHGQFVRGALVADAQCMLS